MPEGDIVWYNSAKKKILDNDIDFLADTIAWKPGSISTLT